MAYTTLPTQSAGGTASAAGWANVVKANFEALYAVRKMKAADETVNNSAALQSDNDFLFTVAANEKWSVNFYLKIDSGTTPDFKFNFTVPAATTYAFTILQAVGGTPAWTNYINTDQSISTSAGGTDPAILQCYFLVGGTAGTVQFVWAQNTATVANTILKAGSSMIAERCD